jgi:hypothetical protein
MYGHFFETKAKRNNESRQEQRFQNGVGFTGETLANATALQKKRVSFAGQT